MTMSDLQMKSVPKMQGKGNFSRTWKEWEKDLLANLKGNLIVPSVDMDSLLPMRTDAELVGLIVTLRKAAISFVMNE